MERTNAPSTQEWVNIPMQTNRGVTGEVLIEISDKTIPGLVLPEIFYNFRKKLGCIFVENHNSEPLLLNTGKVVGLVTSCIVMQDKQGQTPKVRKEDMQNVTGQSNDMNTHKGGASLGDVGKAGRKADSVQSIENKEFYQTKKEKGQFIRKSFQLDMNEILNSDAKLKKAVNK